MQTLKDLREAAFLTQAELAQKCGVSVQTVYSWEKGETVPRFAHIRKLAEVLGKAPQEIFEAVQETKKERPAA